MSSIEKVIAGLQIFSKYGGDVSAEHDRIYARPRFKETISEEDSTRLAELDWKFNNGFEAWYYIL